MAQQQPVPNEQPQIADDQDDFMALMEQEANNVQQQTQNLQNQQAQPTQFAPRANPMFNMPGMPGFNPMMANMPFPRPQPTQSSQPPRNPMGDFNLSEEEMRQADQMLQSLFGPMGGGAPGEANFMQGLQGMFAELNKAMAEDDG